MTLKIKTIDGAEMPKYGTAGAVAFDIAANADVYITGGTIGKVPTGLIVKPPPGYWLMITARSSTQKRGLMLANNVGVVDPDYCGPEDQVYLSVWNFSGKGEHINRGDRIAQGILLPVTKRPEIVSFEPTEASRGGFGSTGT